MKRFYRLYFIVTCLCILACGDRTNVDILTNIGTHIEENAVTDLTPEVWEILRKFRTGDMTYFEWIRTKLPDNFWTGQSQADYEKAIAYAKELKPKQESFYNRYIDADGLAIIGKDCTADKYFIAAKNAYLLMTSKRPELRDRLRGNTYLTVVDGYPIHFVPEVSMWYGGNLYFTGTVSSSRWYPSYHQK